jgi:phosphoribosyl 1,2-cyclic phosphodiesterase
VKVTFWGTRGSIPTPGPSTIKYGGNTPCVELRTNEDYLIIIDGGSGLRSLGNALLATKKPIKGSILLSHTHWDHIQGFPFFKPAFIPGNEFDLYGPQDTSQRIQKVLEGQMEHRYFPVSLSMMGSRISFHELKEQDFAVENLKIGVHYMNHTSLTLGFRIAEGDKSLCYCSDTEPHSLVMESAEKEKDASTNFVHSGDRRFVDFIRGADLLIIDAQYTKNEYQMKKGWGHSDIEYAVMVALLGDVKKLCLFHHDPEHPDDLVDSFVGSCRDKVAEYGKNLEVFAASEGQEVTIR